MNRVAWSFKHNNSPVMVHKIMIPDLTPGDFRLFTDKYLDYMAHMVKNPAIGKFACKVLETDE